MEDKSNENNPNVSRDLISLGRLKLVRHGSNLGPLIRHSDIRSLGLKEQEIVEVFIRKTGDIAEKHNRKGNPLLSRS